MFSFLMIIDTLSSNGCEGVYVELEAAVTVSGFILLWIMFVFILISNKRLKLHHHFLVV